MAVRIIGEINRHLITPIVSVHMGGQEVALLDAQGNSLIGDLPDAPTIIGTIADRVYVVDQTVAPTDLRTKFRDAASYVISPAIAQAVIEGYNLIFDTLALLAETTVTVRGVNARGQSEPLTFTLRVNAPSPQVVEPIPDQSLLIGTANASIPLDDHFSGAASYAVSPTGQGASISGRNLVLSAATARNLEITITATNATGQSVTESFALVVAAQPTLQATISPDPLVAGEDFEIAFSVVPDTVSPTSLVQDQSNLLRYIGTAPDNGTLVIGATKAGYTAYSATFEVSPALPELIVTPSSIFAIANVDAASEPETLALSSPTAPAEMMGEWEIDFAPLASGPVLLRDPYITGTPAVGETMTLHLPPPLSLIAGSEPARDWSWPDGSKGKTYVNRAEDAGVPYDVDVTLMDGIGARTYTTNAVSVPAAASWWDARAYADIDYLNNRARINGVSYASIAAARTAGAITVNSFGADTVTGIPVGASYAVAAVAVMPSDDATNRYVVSLDDGNDGNASDAIAFIQQSVSGGAGRNISHNILSGGVSRVSAGLVAFSNPGTTFRTAIRVKAGAYSFSFNGAMVGSSTDAGAVPAVTELVVGDRSDGTREWPTAIRRVIYINADLTDAELHAVGA